MRSRSVECDKLFLENGGSNVIMSKEERLLSCKWENKSACKECGGKCCQRTGCEASPDDFDCDRNKMAASLGTGNYAIDLVLDEHKRVLKTQGYTLTLDVDFLLHSHEATLFMRPRNQGKPVADIIHIGYSYSPCIFWNRETGCRLPYEERPKYGRAIMPIAPGVCSNIYNTRAMLLKEWYEYNEFLYHMVKRYFDEAWYKYLGFRIT